ncbi:uncharacterized protein A4U43_C01F12020 [Asparagus officinalis]|uniref:CSD domain-containing protein n=2 Tax=Asparagus officinalis TaxID=4686 RepID=A0A5P1FR82_ASPOF|nr:uncharacterized protein A4U43_C01F12020 [Asparagus officinalis]
MAQSSERSKGTVKWFKTIKGYGFITPDDGVQGDLFRPPAHASTRDGYAHSRPGESVEFRVSSATTGRGQGRRVTDLEDLLSRETTDRRGAAVTRG